MLIELTLIGIAGATFFMRKRNKDQLSVKTSEQSDSVNTRSNSSETLYLENSAGKKNFSLTKLFKDVKSVVSDDERQQLTKSADLSTGMRKEQENVNQNIILSAGAVTTALLGSISPLFSILSVTMIMYLARDLYKFIWRDIKSKRFFSLFMINGILIVGMIVDGHLILAAVGGLVGRFFVKIINKTEDHSKKQLVSVFGNHPPKAWLEKDGVEIEVDITAIQPGDVVVVNTGEIIPVDGSIKKGDATIDQHILTGESQPVEKATGDKVFAATLMLSGSIHICVETAGEETVAAKIAKVLENAQNYKDTLVIRGQEIADKFVPFELGITGTTWILKGSGPALTVMWSALGANMISLGPLTVLSYLQILSRNGILIKDGRVLESIRQVDTVVFDKTGTLTMEQPEVTQIHCIADYDEDTLLGYAAAAEYRHTHPIARAIVDKSESKDINLPDLDEADYEVGYGIKVRINGDRIFIGSARFMSREGIELPEITMDIQNKAESEGFSLIYISINNQLKGIFEIHPTIRPEAAEIIQYLKQRNIKLYIVSGDHEEPTRCMAEALGIDNYFAEVLPENKADLVKGLSKEGRFVCFIGDGINDAIALKSAQVSISLKGASTVAVDTAQIVLMDGSLNHLKQLFELVDQFENTMSTNFKATIVPGVICIGGVYLFNFGLLTGMVLYYLGTVVGVSNTLWPLVKYQKDEPIEIEDKRPCEVDGFVKTTSIRTKR